MTTKEFTLTMSAICKRYHDDQELCHMLMDDVMCTALKELGYDEGIDIFESTDKWYA